jgi:RNA polymerase sigma-70 factor (ECF subfamily)
MGAQPAAESMTPTDAAVVERAQAGDRDAFRVLVERYQGRVFRLALRVMRDEEQARDVSQEAFLKVYRSIDRFEGRSSFYTWLYRLTMNVCLDAKRRDKSDRHVEWNEEVALDTEGGISGPAPLAAPSKSLERSELRESMQKAIDELPDDARRTFLLREVDGLSYMEIATALEIPKGTVMSRLHYARRRLREALLESGAAEPAPETSGGVEA